MDYDLTRLGSREFEHLTQSLTLKDLGGRVVVFGDGPDGGRDATFTGKVTWNPDNPDENWDGYVVMQAKFRSRPLGTKEDTDWFFRHIESELKHWATPDPRALKRGRRPEYLLMVTNVVLAPASDRGGIDRVEALIRSFARQLKLKGWKIWHYDHLCRLLDGNDSVRKAFAGLIMPGDVLYRIHEYLNTISINLGETMSRHVSMELTADQWVRLSQAGETANSKLALSSVAVDLPINKTGIRGLQAASYIIAEGDRMLRSDRDATKRPHMVLVGGPGQGKTTIGQLVCQVYRAALLGDEPQVGLEESRLLAACRQGFRRVGLQTPLYRRWPIRVDLSAYSDAALGGSGQMSLLRYIAAQVGQRTSDALDSSHMRSWLRDWPWLLVLDGLDEVPAAGARDRIMQGISDLLVEAARVNADLFIVATTRPQGYVGEFSEDQYDHVTLASLNPEQATLYARRLAEVRHSNDPDMYSKLIMRTELAAKEDVTARLMRTPLQVTIMSLLLEGRERAPQARYALFEAYYNTIYAREVAKPGRLGRLLETQRSNVNALHDRVGLLLQVQAEQGEAEASIPRDRLGELAFERLKREGYEETDARRLAEEIIAAVTRRLVLLVPKGLDEVGFEVRSIQEFMAARALVSGLDTAVIDRLREIIASVHWRNTWLLAAGRIFAEREHMRSSLVSILSEADNSDELHLAVAPGADLALDLLEDDLAINAPNIRRMLASQALTLLQRAPDESLLRRAGVLFNCADDKVIRISLDQAVDQALQSSAARHETAQLLLQIWQQQTGGLALRSRQILAKQGAMVRYSDAGSFSTPVPYKRETLAELLRPKLRRSNLTEREATLADAFLKTFRGVALPSDNTKLSATDELAEAAAADRDNVDAAFRAEGIAAAVAGVYFDVAQQTWAKASALRSLMRTWLQRRAAGEAILAASTSQDLSEH
jgi:hypothetical protein